MDFAKIGPKVALKNVSEGLEPLAVWCGHEKFKKCAEILQKKRVGGPRAPSGLGSKNRLWDACRVHCSGLADFVEFPVARMQILSRRFNR